MVNKMRPPKSWWPGDERVSRFMPPVSEAIKRHLDWPSQGYSDIYNRAYEAVFLAIKEHFLKPDWQPFPDSFGGLPEVGRLYDVTREDHEGMRHVDQMVFHNVPAWMYAHVIAFCEAPEPYQPPAPKRAEPGGTS